MICFRFHCIARKFTVPDNIEEDVEGEPGMYELYICIIFIITP